MKVAIIGTAPGWELAPWGDPTWERWGLNDGYLQHGPSRQCTRWFELHGNTELTRSRRRADHFARIAEMEIPVYYLTGEPPSPKAIRFPLDAAIAAGRDYFACTNAYQIALALSEGATEIAIYGTPLQGAREATVERPCVAWWLGLAEGRGVTVSVHHTMKLGLLRHPFRYALDDQEERESSYWAAKELYGSLYSWVGEESARITRRRLVDEPTAPVVGLVACDNEELVTH